MHDGYDHRSAVKAPAPTHPAIARVDVDEFRAHPIFQGVKEQVVERLLQASTGLQYRERSIIVREGAGLSGLQIIQRGLVDLAHIDGDNECGVLLLSPKDLLMPGASLFAEDALVTAMALTTTRLVIIEPSAVDAVLEESGVFARNVMNAVSGQWRMAVRNILDLNCRSAAQRLACFLLRLVDLQADSPAPLLPIAKRHLAGRLGMTAETLSRMLQVIATEGIYLRGRTIIVRNRARADEFCGPDPYSSRDDRHPNVFAL